MAGLGVIEQSDFSAGMFRGVRAERQPAASVYDSLNGLVSDDGAIYRRGGTVYRSSSAFGTGLTFIWDGLLTGGSRTLIAHPTAFATVAANGTVTSLGGAGVDAPLRGTVMDGKLYLPPGITYDGTTLGTPAKLGSYYASVANRLFVAQGDRVDFSNIGDAATFGTTDFHRLPEGVTIIGAEGLRDSLALFTTGGVWVLTNLAYNLTDDAGNVQQALDQYSRDLVLWGDAGIAGWEGALVVPGIDAVWLMARGVTSEVDQPLRKISLSIERLYQDYVHRGYQPGQAAVYRSHYFLPILDVDNTVRDLLVCRLDLPSTPWMRLGGFGGTVAAFTVPASSGTSRDPKLLAAQAAGRVLTANYLDPGVGSATDADGSAYPFQVTTHDVQTGVADRNTVVFLDVSYELGDPGGVNPTLKAERVSGRPLVGQAEWGLFSWGQADWGQPAPAVPLVGEAPQDLFGDYPFRWPVRSRARFMRFRLSCSQAATRLVLRRLRMFVRENGR